MAQLSNLPDLTALAFESACDPGGLREFVAAAAGYFNADGVVIAIWPHASPDHLLPVCFQLDPDDVQAWFAARDHRDSLFGCLQAERVLGLVAGNGPAAGWPDGAALATVVERDPANSFGLLLVRDSLAGFSQADRDALTQVSGYLRRAVALNRRFIRVFAEHRAARLLLDSAPRGIVVLGQRGQPTYVNDEARRIADSLDGVSLDQDQVLLDDTDAMLRLGQFLDRARDREAATRSTSISARRNGKDLPAYQLLGYALEFDRRQAALDDREGLAILLLHDPAMVASPSDALLDTFFGLTRAEAHLAQALCSGRSLPTAAEELSISVNTARTHLRSVFNKVGVHSQAALVQRVSQSLHLARQLS